MAPFPCPTKVYHQESYPAIDPSRPELSAKGKTIIVTGGGSGLGPSICDAFAKAGATKIIILGRTKTTLLETKKTLEETYKGVEVTTFVADVVDEDAITKAAAAIKEKFGTWDVLVSNAGYSPDMATVKDADTKDWWRAYEVNVLGGFIITRAFVGLASPNGTLINMTSAAAHFPQLFRMSAYGSSKTASTKLFEFIGQEHPELRVFNAHPGVVLTPMHQKNLDNGLKLPVTEDNINLPASFMVWLASPESEFGRGKLLWANWDVDELKGMATEIKENSKYTMVLDGWM